MLKQGGRTGRSSKPYPEIVADEDRDRLECEKNIEASQESAVSQAHDSALLLLSPVKSSLKSFASLDEVVLINDDDLKDIGVAMEMDLKASAESTMLKTNQAFSSPAKSMSSQGNGSAAVFSPVNKTTSQVAVLQTPCSPAKSGSSSSADFFANKKRQIDENRTKIHLQLKEIEVLCPPLRKCRAFEDVKRLRTEYDLLTRNTKDAEIRLQLADSVLDEVKAIWKRRSLLMEQLQLL